MLSLVNLADVADKRIGGFSGGMKRRLGIAQAELSSPEVLVFDEPTAGLDPKERVRFRNLLAELSKSRIVLLSTHIVSDIASIADHVLVMREGALVFEAPMDESLRGLEGRVWELELPERQAASALSRYQTLSVEPIGPCTRLRVVSDGRPSAEARLQEPTLEDLFLLFTEGQRLKEGSI